MNDQLDALLTRDAHVPLDDAGFTARVMRTLPRRGMGSRELWRPALLLGSAALGSALAALFLPAGSSLFQGYIDLVQNRGFTPAAVAALTLAAVLAISSLVLAADTD